MISVVIPAYNAEKSLLPTVQSIQAQSVSDLQIIIVDDGSQDGTAALIDELAQQDGRIVAVHQENAGPGMARNTALDLATGEWLVFVDADDTVEPTYFAELLEAAEVTGADLVISDCLLCQGGGARPFGFIKPGVVYENRQQLWEDFVASHISWPLWGRLYAARLWEGVRFNPEDYIAEDLDANARIFSRLDMRVATIASTGYHYSIGEGTVDTTFTSRHLQQFEVFEHVYYQAASYGLDASVWYVERVLNCLKKAIAAGAPTAPVVDALKRHKADALACPLCDRGLALRMRLACGGAVGHKLLMRV